MNALNHDNKNDLFLANGDRLEISDFRSFVNKSKAVTIWTSNFPWMFSDQKKDFAFFEKSFKILITMHAKCMVNQTGRHDIPPFQAVHLENNIMSTFFSRTIGIHYSEEP
jgi:hypothetical protein